MRAQSRHTCSAAKGSLRCAACASGDPPDRRLAFGVEVLRIVRPGSHFEAPLLMVRCRICTGSYHTRSWISDVSRRRSCHDCQSLFRRKARSS